MSETPAVYNDWTFSPSSRGRLTRRDLGRFSGSSLFDRLARTVCQAGCLPRKELYEAWEMARRVRRRFRGGRVVDLAAGHGLLAWTMLILDEGSPNAVAVDKVPAASRTRVGDALRGTWPQLAGRVEWRTCDVDDVALGPDDLVVASHACGALTDRVLARAIEARARVAVLPCCHDAAVSETAGLSGWLDTATAIDVTRAVKLQAHGYQIWTQRIPPRITQKNRLLLAAPM